MNRKIFRDECIVSDSTFGPKGFVIITDKDGKILVKKHNMIVKDGKDYIFATVINKIFNGIGFNKVDNYDSTMLDYSITEIRFGCSTNETEFTRSYGEDSESIHLLHEVSEDGVPSYHHPLSASEITIGTSDNHPYIVINKELTFNSSVNIDNVSELELIMSNGEDKKLFSRIKFDIIPISAGSEFTIEYYIYF